MARSSRDPSLPETSPFGDSSLAPPTSKAEYVLTRLRQAIVDGHLGPGDPIHQEDVASKLGVSATPVREALRRLEAEGAIVYVPNRGATVAELSPENVQDLYALRSRVEGLATLLATERGQDQLDGIERLNDELDHLRLSGASGDALGSLNRRFHFAIYEAARSQLLITHIETLWTMFPVRANAHLWAVPEHASRFVHDHGLVIEAMRAGDATTAEAVMAEHVAMSAALRPATP